MQRDNIVIIVAKLCIFIYFFFFFVIIAKKRITIKQKNICTGGLSKWKSGNCHFLDHFNCINNSKKTTSI